VREGDEDPFFYLLSFYARGRLVARISNYRLLAHEWDLFVPPLFWFFFTVRIVPPERTFIEKYEIGQSDGLSLERGMIAL